MASETYYERYYNNDEDSLPCEGLLKEADAEIARLRGLVGRMRDELHYLSTPSCDRCIKGAWESTPDHANDCPIAALIAEAEKECKS